jgi:hypothetical protein
MSNNEQANAPTVYPFPWPDEHKGYALFPKDLEDDDLVLFHGTPQRNFDAILKEGFKPTGSLGSVSYAKKSVSALTHLMTNRIAEEVYVVFAVRFETLKTEGIQENLSDIHVYKPDLQPLILGYVTVPHDYQHR